jgi:cholesterol oxidase
MSPTLGLTFSEVMTGGFVLGASDPATGERQGNAQNSQLALHCEVTINDLERFVQDPQHPGRLVCTVDFASLGAGIPCDPGIFNLFCPANTPDQRWMVYECEFAANGQHYYLAGRKIVQHGHASEVLQQITTLYTVLYEGTDATGKVAGAGTLHLRAKSIADMAKSLHVNNAQNQLEVLKGLGMYLKLFLGELWQTYI